MAQESNGLKFSELTDRNIRLRIIDAAAKKKATVTLWIQDKTIQFETKLIKHHPLYNEIELELPSNVSWERFTEGLIGQTTKEIYGSLLLDKSTFLFKTVLVGRTGSLIFKLKTPEKLFMLRQRSALRVSVDQRFPPIKITLFDPTKEFPKDGLVKQENVLEFKMLDLSTGGFAIGAHSPELAEKFVRGIILQDIRFKLYDTQIIAEGTVAYNKCPNQPTEPPHKIGIKFKNLKPDSENMIARFVAEESRKLFTRQH